MCHYLLDNGHGRAKDGDKCLSYKPKRKEGLDKLGTSNYDIKGDITKCKMKSKNEDWQGCYG